MTSVWSVSCVLSHSLIYFRAYLLGIGSECFRNLMVARTKAMVSVFRFDFSRYEWARVQSTKADKDNYDPNLTKRIHREKHVS